MTLRPSNDGNHDRADRLDADHTSTEPSTCQAPNSWAFSTESTAALVAVMNDTLQA
jgi:hypothetical protein